MARTRLQLKEFALRDVVGSVADDTMTSRVENALEVALGMLARKRHWNCHKRTYEFVTIAPYSTGTVSINIGSTSVTGSGTTFPANSPGQRIEFAGERHWFEITARGTGTALTILDAYSNKAVASLSDAAYKIVYPLYDLPSDFGRLLPEGNGLFDVDSGADTMSYVEYDLMTALQASKAGAGKHQCFTVRPKRNAPDTKQIELFPPPSDTTRYQLVYFRRPGWFDSATPATSVWKAKATADTDVVDWPDDLDYVMESAVRAAVARAINHARYQDYIGMFNRDVGEAENFDRQHPGIMLLSRGQPVQVGTRYNFTEVP